MEACQHLPGQSDRAAALLAEMGDIANVQTYNAAISAMKLDGDWRRCVELFETMKATERDKCQPVSSDAYLQ